MDTAFARPRTGPAAGSSARDLFLDTIRAVAIVRVVAWHTFGWAPLTWVVSAVPAMIFVSGHLLAQSAQRRPLAVVLTDRLRRLLIPFWLFGVAAWAIMIGADYLRARPETALPLRSLPLWILPINDPRGSVWEAGWLSQPLWYLRVLLLLLLTSPLLLRLARRPAVSSFGLLAITVGLELFDRHAHWHPSWAPDLTWRAGDYTLYATFFLLGAANHNGFLNIRRAADWAAAGVVSALCATSFAIALHPQDGVANNSHIVHFCVGAAWLCFAFAARAPITRWVSHGWPYQLVRAIGRRSLTIYLWHSGCAITVWHVLAENAPLPRGVHSTLLGLGTALLTTAAVLVFGPIEDVAAGRERTVRPARAVAPTTWAVRVAGIALVTLCVALTLPADEPVRQLLAPATSVAPSADSSAASPASTRRPAAPRVPSQAPRRPEFQRPVADATAVPVRPATTIPRADATQPITTRGAAAIEPWSPEKTPASAELAAELDDAVNRWMAGWGISGIRVALARPDSFAWKGAYGADWDETPLDAASAFDIESITKTFTASVVWQLVGEGSIDLDATVPALDTVPEFPGDTYTVRQLLDHRTGIPDYHDTYDFGPDGYAPIDRAIASALLAPQLAPAGVAQYYSSTNYLILGRYLEAQTGKSIQTLLSERVLEPNGIASRFTHAPSTYDAPGGGAAGLISTLDGLLVWGDVLLRRHLPVGDAGFARMANLSPSTSLGPGLYGYCPCTYDFDERPVWQRIGHSGGTTSLQYERDGDLVIALQVPSGVWGNNDQPLELLIERLLDIARRY